MKYWIFTDAKNSEFSTTKFASIAGTVSSAFVIFKTATAGIDPALLTQVFIYLGTLVFGMAAVRRVGNGKTVTPPNVPPTS